MPLLEIKKFGCPVLRRQAVPVTDFNEDLRQLVSDMFETMYEAQGIGLAAPQVGVLSRVIVMDLGVHDPACRPVALINPEVVEVQGEVEADEGCLSFPDITADVKRPTSARVRGLDANGKPIVYEATDLGARVVLHEIDHLNGILFIDHVGSLKRQFMRAALRKLQKEGEKQSLSKKGADRKPVHARS